MRARLYAGSDNGERAGRFCSRIQSRPVTTGLSRWGTQTLATASEWRSRPGTRGQEGVLISGSLLVRCSDRERVSAPGVIDEHRSIARAGNSAPTKPCCTARSRRRSGGAMKFSIASLSCLVAAIVMISIRGGEDWSAAFGVAWYGLFGVAVVLAIVAVGIAVAARGVTGSRRLLIVALAIPALIAVPLLILVISMTAPLAN